MTQPTPPVIGTKNPADGGTLGGTMRTVLRKHQQAHQGQLPAIVVSYDRAANRATVRPLITMLASNMTPIKRASLAAVPVLALGGGGYTMTFPLKAGDLGWIEASDRDISLFMQSMAEARPNVLTLHQFEFGRFVPDAFHQYTFDTADASSMVIQSYDGTRKIRLTPTSVDVIGPNVNVTATENITMTAGAQLSIMAGTKILMTAPAIAMVQTGGGTGTTFSGAPVVIPDAIINGVTQSTHKHAGVQSGGSVSDGPQN